MNSGEVEFIDDFSYRILESSISEDIVSKFLSEERLEFKNVLDYFQKSADFNTLCTLSQVLEYPKYEKFSAQICKRNLDEKLYTKPIEVLSVKVNIESPRKWSVFGDLQFPIFPGCILILFPQVQDGNSVESSSAILGITIGVKFENPVYDLEVAIVPQGNSPKAQDSLEVPEDLYVSLLFSIRERFGIRNMLQESKMSKRKNRPSEIPAVSSLLKSILNFLGMPETSLLRKIRGVESRKFEKEEIEMNRIEAMLIASEIFHLPMNQSRAVQLALGIRALNQERRETGPVTVISGLPGSGKTTVLAALCSILWRVETRKALVVSGSFSSLYSLLETLFKKFCDPEDCRNPNLADEPSLLHIDNNEYPAIIAKFLKIWPLKCCTVGVHPEKHKVRSSFSIESTSWTDSQAYEEYSFKNSEFEFGMLSLEKRTCTIVTCLQRLKAQAKKLTSYTSDSHVEFHEFREAAFNSRGEFENLFHQIRSHVPASAYIEENEPSKVITDQYASQIAKKLWKIQIIVQDYLSEVNENLARAKPGDSIAGNLILCLTGIQSVVTELLGRNGKVVPAIAEEILSSCNLVFILASRSSLPWKENSSKKAPSDPRFVEISDHFSPHTIIFDQAEKIPESISNLVLQSFPKSRNVAFVGTNWPSYDSLWDWKPPKSGNILCTTFQRLINASQEKKPVDLYKTVDNDVVCFELEPYSRSRRPAFDVPLPWNFHRPDLNGASSSLLSPPSTATLYSNARIPPVCNMFFSNQFRDFRYLLIDMPDEFSISQITSFWLTVLLHVCPQLAVEHSCFAWKSSICNQPRFYVRSSAKSALKVAIAIHNPNECEKVRNQIDHFFGKQSFMTFLIGSPTQLAGTEYDFTLLILDSAMDKQFVKDQTYELAVEICTSFTKSGFLVLAPWHKLNLNNDNFWSRLCKHSNFNQLTVAETKTIEPLRNIPDNLEAEFTTPDHPCIVLTVKIRNMIDKALKNEDCSFHEVYTLFLSFFHSLCEGKLQKESDLRDFEFHRIEKPSKDQGRRNYVCIISTYAWRRIGTSMKLHIFFWDVILGDAPKTDPIPWIDSLIKMRHLQTNLYFRRALLESSRNHESRYFVSELEEFKNDPFEFKFQILEKGLKNPMFSESQFQIQMDTNLWHLTDVMDPLLPPEKIGYTDKKIKQCVDYSLLYFKMLDVSIPLSGLKQLKWEVYADPVVKEAITATVVAERLDFFVMVDALEEDFKISCLEVLSAKLLFDIRREWNLKKTVTQPRLVIVPEEGLVCEVQKIKTQIKNWTSIEDLEYLIHVIPLQMFLNESTQEKNSEELAVKKRLPIFDFLCETDIRNWMLEFILSPRKDLMAKLRLEGKNAPEDRSFTKHVLYMFEQLCSQFFANHHTEASQNPISFTTDCVPPSAMGATVYILSPETIRSDHLCALRNLIRKYFSKTSFFAVGNMFPYPDTVSTRSEVIWSLFTMSEASKLIYCRGPGLTRKRLLRIYASESVRLFLEDLLTITTPTYELDRLQVRKNRVRLQNRFIFDNQQNLIQDFENRLLKVPNKLASHTEFEIESHNSNILFKDTLIYSSTKSPEEILEPKSSIYDILKLNENYSFEICVPKLDSPAFTHPLCAAISFLSLLTIPLSVSFSNPGIAHALPNEINLTQLEKNKDLDIKRWGWAVRDPNSQEEPDPESCVRRSQKHNLLTSHKLEDVTKTIPRVNNLISSVKHGLFKESIFTKSVSKSSGVSQCFPGFPSNQIPEFHSTMESQSSSSESSESLPEIESLDFESKVSEDLENQTAKEEIWESNSLPEDNQKRVSSDQNEESSDQKAKSLESEGHESRLEETEDEDLKTDDEYYRKILSPRSFCALVQARKSTDYKEYKQKKRVDRERRKSQQHVFTSSEGDTDYKEYKQKKRVDRDRRKSKQRAFTSSEGDTDYKEYKQRKRVDRERRKSKQRVFTSSEDEAHRHQSGRKNNRRNNEDFVESVADYIRSHQNIRRRKDRKAAYDTTFGDGEYDFGRSTKSPLSRKERKTKLRSRILEEPFLRKLRSRRSRRVEEYSDTSSDFGDERVQSRRSSHYTSYSKDRKISDRKRGDLSFSADFEAKKQLAKQEKEAAKRKTKRLWEERFNF
eukprot:GHVP01014203.1.p1 GENE.GHVP01014203.1~~GHVP01014203.1.p1  ORF type:complete len:2112 (-),score=373.98 GHVP01014203.1:6484-12795(-)